MQGCLLILLVLVIPNVVPFSLYDVDAYDPWERDFFDEVDDNTKCKKDILILWDTSASIGYNNFVDKVAPFILRLIQSDTLQVGEDGTHIGIIVFSDKGKTKTLLEFGKKTKKIDLINFLKKYTDSATYTMDDYLEELGGDRTYTGKAFQLAAENFTEKSPSNYRKDVEDVILLFTDGEPKADGKQTDTDKETKLADDYSKLLREERNIKIIGLGIGNKVEFNEFKQHLIDWSSQPSEENVFRATEDELKHVVEKLVDPLCKHFPIPGDCVCTKPSEITAFAPNGEDVKLNLTGVVEKPTCTEDATYIENPTHPISPPDALEPGKKYFVGRHEITYFYTSDKTGPFNCSFNVDVFPCNCPSTEEINTRISPGESTAYVSWSKPVPLCDVIPNEKNPKSTRGRYSKGHHTLNYHYTAGSNLQKFELTCHVNIHVTGEFCGDTVYDPTTHVCCCNQAHEKKNGYKCCGENYFDPGVKLCCQGANLVNFGGNCPMNSLA